LQKYPKAIENKALGRHLLAEQAWLGRFGPKCADGANHKRSQQGAQFK
jgi:hypothetical protein